MLFPCAFGILPKPGASPVALGRVTHPFLLEAGSNKNLPSVPLA